MCLKTHELFRRCYCKYMKRANRVLPSPTASAELTRKAHDQLGIMNLDAVLRKEEVRIHGYNASVRQPCTLVFP